MDSNPNTKQSKAVGRAQATASMSPNYMVHSVYKAQHQFLQKNL